MSQPSNSISIDTLRTAFGDTVQVNASMAGHTTARVGGPADALIVAHSAKDLEQAVRRLWELEMPFFVLGFGSNVLVSDQGLRSVVVLNRARSIQINAGSEQTGAAPFVQAESGALIGTIARLTALQGLSGFEWAAAVPGTLGGAVYGNAGAYDGNMASSLLLAEILHPQGKELWPVEKMQYTYRSSLLKRNHSPAVILTAQIKLEPGDPGSVKAKMEEFTIHRRRTQPPGASLGSMFKNPPGDYAGRLIEAAGLKGRRIGQAEISTRHGNFFVNHGGASAADVGRLIRLARETVAERFGIWLDLEVELLGDWSTVLEHGNKNSDRQYGQGDLHEGA